jgi:hypothetical protein
MVTLNAHITEAGLTPTDQTQQKSCKRRVPSYWVCIKDAKNFSVIKIKVSTPSPCFIS